MKIHRLNRSKLNAKYNLTPTKTKHTKPLDAIEIYLIINVHIEDRNASRLKKKNNKKNNKMKSK